MEVSFVAYGCYIFYVCGLVLLHFRVRDCYVCGLVFLRFVVSNSYVQGLVFLCLGFFFFFLRLRFVFFTFGSKGILTFRG